MRKLTIISIGSVSLALLMMSANVVLAASGNKSGNGIPQEITSLQSQIASLQLTVSTQSRQISSQKSDITSLQSTVST